MHGHLREDTKVPLGNIPYLLHLICVLNQQQVTTVQLIRLISEGGKKNQPNVKMNQVLCKLSSPTASSWLKMGTSCANTARHHQLHGDFIQGKNNLECGLQQTIPIPSNNLQQQRVESWRRKRHM